MRDTNGIKPLLSGVFVTGDVARKFRGMTGHSQGLTPAVVAAVSSTEEQFVNNTLLAVRLLLCIGMHTLVFLFGVIRYSHSTGGTLCTRCLCEIIL